MPKVEYPLTPVEEIPAEGSKLVEFFGRQLHIVRAAGGAPSAFMNVCTHFGGTLSCVNGEFRCEWHGARFDSRSGERVGGLAPVGSRMMLLPTVVKDGVLTYVFSWDD